MFVGHLRKMSPCKCSLFMLLGGLLLIGLPNGVRPEPLTEETKTSSVKECRVHIEKALEQYWDHKEPENANDPLKHAENINTQNVDDENNDVVPQESEIKYHPNVDEDEDDEEEDDINETEEPDIEDDDDDIKETDNEFQISENTNLEDDEPENHDTTEEEDDDEIDDEDRESEESDEIIDNELSINETEKEQNEQDIEDDDEDEDEDEETESIIESTDDAGGEDEVTTQGELENELENNSEEEEEDEEDEDDEDETIIEETTTKDTSDEQIIIKETAGESTFEDKEGTESDKVTGEADSASARVVSKLSEDKPSIKQPETTKASEETIRIITTVEEQQKTSQEDNIEEQPSESVQDDKDDDTIENIYEEEDDDELSSSMTFRSRNHIDVILGLDEIGTEYEKEEEKLAQSVFKEIKKIEITNIKPMEMLYKYTDSTTRVLGDAEIFNKQMLLFLGPWSGGKTTIINYLLGIERTPAALKTGTGITDVDFTLVTYGDQKQVISGTELATDWKYAGVQKFGQGFLDHFRSIQIPSTLLKRVTIVDTPGILESKKNTERGYNLNDAFQWFIDRADAIYVVLDPNKVDIGGELGSVLDALRGREVRFILNKADTIRRSDLMRVVGQLFWNLSPLMSSTEVPVIYAVSLTTKPYHASAPARFLADQENNFLYDMKDTLEKRVENKILYTRRHAVRVRNHAKMIDCYLATYYRHKSIFSNKKNVAKLITENPRDYNIFEGIESMTNVSRYELPNPNIYKEFFKVHPLYDFKPLVSTCSYFRGCPIDKLDAAIAYDIPELFAKYKKAKSALNFVKQEGR